MIGFTEKELILFENALENYVQSDDISHDKLFSSMRYSLMAGGKRIRPYILWAFCKICGGSFKDCLAFACAAEMIHTYSLIHDDLPCMDNDDLRRGKPTNHKVYGEATAILAADALQALAFEIMLSEETIEKVGAEKAAKAAGVLAKYAGAKGMCGGQAIDIDSQGKKINADTLIKMNSEKTGALIAACAQMGCIVGGANKIELDAAYKYAVNLGLAFQAVDDLLDVQSSEAELGKTIGSDLGNEKSTYVSIFEVQRAREIAKEYTQKAIDALGVFEKNTDDLKSLAEELLKRKY